MVQVIGKDESIYRKTTCTGCASILKYEKRDVKQQSYSDYSGVSDTYYWITCPECDEKVYVSRWY